MAQERSHGPDYPGGMARSPLTLAAAAVSALPRVRVVGAGELTAHGAGRHDAAVVTTEDGRTLVVRAPVDADAARELAAEALALRALSPGVRELLGLRAPELLGEAGLGDVRALVTDLLPGYQIDGSHLPAGDGAATSAGRALAAVHALPTSVVRAEGLPQRTPEEVRVEVAALIESAASTGKVPHTLAQRWRAAVANDPLWRFESTVTLGGAGAASFLFEDTESGPAVSGLLDWHALGVGDPAVDLHWLASAPQAADDVLAGYLQAAHRSPDAWLRARSRLYAELEFAKWLLHGSRSRRLEIIEDAVGLLDALAENVRGDDLLAAPGDTSAEVDDALSAADRVAAAPETDTSLQTDAYSREELAQFVETDTEIDTETDARHDAAADAAEADRASREALRRWASS